MFIYYGHISTLIMLFFHGLWITIFLAFLTVVNCSIYTTTNCTNVTSKCTSCRSPLTCNREVEAVNLQRYLHVGLPLTQNCADQSSGKIVQKIRIALCMYV